jgi:pumilio homology domain family member 6
VTTSRESHQKQKTLAAERKASKPNADEIARAKKLWERLRVKSNVPKEERQTLVDQLFEVVLGRVVDFVFKHDSVRVIQCALKYANLEQKKIIATELKGNYKNLAESRYGKFLVAKVITETDDDVRDMVVPEFYGHVRRMMNHPEGSWILDDVYRTVATDDQKAILLREWYGPEFSIFKTQDKSQLALDLGKILNKSPEKRVPVMSYLHERINQLIQKKMTGFTMLHDAMLQYFLNVAPGSEERSAFLTLIVGDTKEEEVDLLRNLAFTRSGSRIVCLTLAYSSAKDRKKILRAYKDVIETLAFDVWGHMVLLTAYDVVDDTRLTTQGIYNELVLMTKTASAEAQTEKVVGLMTHQVGLVSLMYPFVGAHPKLVHPPALKVMQEVHRIRMETSKKDSKLRMAELIAPLSPICLTAIEQRAADIVATSFGCLSVTETILGAVGDKSAAVSAIAQLTSGDPSSEEHISHSPWFGKMLKSLVAGGRWDKKAGRVIQLEPPLHFEVQLLTVIEPHLKDWVVGDGGFVVLALLEANWESQDKPKILKQTLKAYKADLEKLVQIGVKIPKRSEEEGDSDKRRRATASKLLLEALNE